MKNKITSGIWFVFIGLVLLLHNMGVIDFNFWAILKYWPLLIIIVGIKLLTQNRPQGLYIQVGCTILFLGWIFYIGITDKSRNWMDYAHIRTNSLHGIDSAYASKIAVPYDSLLKEASIEFRAGGGSFEMESVSSAELFSAESPDKSMGINLEEHETDGKKKFIVDIMPESKSKKSNKTVIALHPNILWDLHFNYGAAYIDSDISALRFKSMELQSGVSNIKLRLGQPQTGISKIEINTGASTIELRVPKDAEMRINYTSVLSSTSFEGFASNADGEAKTAHYDEAENKYDMELNGAANDIKIIRY